MIGFNNKRIAQWYLNKLIEEEAEKQAFEKD